MGHALAKRRNGAASRQHVPPTCDPRWKGWSAPLLEYIRESPRTWDELHEWERANSIRPSMMKHMLCWLEFHGRVAALGEKPVLWFAPK